MGRTGCSLVRKLWLCFLFFNPEHPSRSLWQTAALRSRLDSSSCCYLHTAKYFHWLSVAFWKQTFYFPQLIKLVLFKGCGETSMLQGVKNIFFCCTPSIVFMLKFSAVARFCLDSKCTAEELLWHITFTAFVPLALLPPCVLPKSIFFSSPVGVSSLSGPCSDFLFATIFWLWILTIVKHCSKN